MHRHTLCSNDEWRYRHTEQKPVLLVRDMAIGDAERMWLTCGAASYSHCPRIIARVSAPMVASASSNWSRCAIVWWPCSISIGMRPQNVKFTWFCQVWRSTRWRQHIVCLVFGMDLLRRDVLWYHQRVHARLVWVIWALHRFLGEKINPKRYELVRNCIEI